MTENTSSTSHETIHSEARDECFANLKRLGQAVTSLEEREETKESIKQEIHDRIEKLAKAIAPEEV